MKFIDSSVFIAFFRKNDEGHARARELLTAHANETLLCPVPVLQEVAERIRRLDNNRVASQAVHAILTNNISIECPSPEELFEASRIMEKFDQVSFCDATQYAMMKKAHAKLVLSFDSDFDRLPGITRIH